MRPVVVVETNFVVQAVSQRDGTEQIAAVEAILERSRKGDLRLAIPAFSLLEAGFVLRQAEKRRNRLSNSLASEEAELRRSPLSFGAASELAAFRSSLVAIQGQESVAYNDLLQHFIELNGVIELSLAVITEATAGQSRLALSLADGMVYASVRQYLEGLGPRDSPRLFLTYNRKDFDQEDVKAGLRALDCELLFDARAAVSFVDRS